LVLEEGDPVAQHKLALLQPLQLELVDGTNDLQSFYRSVEVSMRLKQLFGFRLICPALVLAQFISHLRSPRLAPPSPRFRPNAPGPTRLEYG
jgi:hypothetical protein